MHCCWQWGDFSDPSASPPPCCVSFCVCIKTQHNRYERDHNILNGKPSLKGLSRASPEAAPLLRAMLDRDPSLRPSAASVVAHPFWWSADRKLLFLSELSDRVELEDRVEQARHLPRATYPMLPALLPALMPAPHHLLRKQRACMYACAAGNASRPPP